MYCDKCGNKLDEGSNVCTFCNPTQTTNDVENLQSGMQMNQPNVNQPFMGGQPNMNQPNMNQPFMGGQPNMNQPNVNQPFMGGQPNMGQPNVNQPFMGGQPYMNQPNMNQYNMPPNQPFNQFMTPTKKKKSKALIAIIMTIILIGVGVLGVLYFDPFNKDEEERSYFEHILNTNNKDILVNDSVNTTIFTITASGNVESVKLIDKESGEKFDMTDTGDVNIGDELSNDGVYSYLATIDNKSAKLIDYYAELTIDGKKIKSNTISINVYEALTDAEANTIKEVYTNATLTSAISKIIATDSEKEKDSALDEIVAYFNDLEKGGTIKGLSGGKKDGSISFEFASGVLGGFILDADEEAFEAYMESANAITNATISASALLNAISSSSSSSDDKLHVPDTKNTVGSNKVLILSSFTETPSNFTASYTALKEKFDNYKDYDFDTTIKFNATLSDYRSLNGYGQIYINSHGSVHKNNPIICLDEEATTENIKTNSADLKAKRIAVFGTAIDTDATYAILPSFIEHYYANSRLDNSLVYMCICHGFHNKNLANAFLDVGAGAVTGFTDSVLVSFDRKIIGTYVDKLLEGLTVEKAVDEAIAEHGTNDSDSTPAYFQRVGNPNLRILNTGIHNGSFEEGLKYWAPSGDSRVISSLEDISNTHESYMSIISTGLGAISDSNSTVSQTFIVPGDATTIKFSYNVVSEEPLEYVNSAYDDVFKVVVVSEGKEETIVYENVNDSEWIEVGENYFPGGDETTYHTEWKSKTIDVTKYRGKCITLKFWTYDVGDSAYDTAGLVDNVRMYVKK